MVTLFSITFKEKKIQTVWEVRLILSGNSYKTWIFLYNFRTATILYFKASHFKTNLCISYVPEELFFTLSNKRRMFLTRLSVILQAVKPAISIERHSCSCHVLTDHLILRALIFVRMFSNDSVDLKCSLRLIKENKNKRND